MSNDDFKDLENNIDNVGNGCFWAIILFMLIVLFITLF